MIRTLAIDRLRGFSHFELHDLGRVNLLVGTNNCGKTTVLEGVQILASQGDFSAIWRILARRGEDLYDDRERGTGVTRHVDVRRLFHGHEIMPGNRIEIKGASNSQNISFSAQIVESRGTHPPIQPQLFDEPPSTEASTGSLDYGVSEEFVPPSALVLTWDGPPPTQASINLGRRGGISSEALRRATPAGIEPESGLARLITTAALSPETVIELFESVVLTPEEDQVIEALKIIEPSIERIATSGTDRWRTGGRSAASRGGMLVRCKGIKSRIPIGSMGDGIWRMLGLALALVQAENGILLVDEIDTGLHFTVMADMWRLVYKTARRLNVQVFATTHSRDCYESLAVICREQVSEGSDITIQRIERGSRVAVGYTEQEIVAAAERGMEVR